MKKIGLLLLVSIFTLFSCAKPPVAEIDAANAAVSQAEANADVKEYAGASLTRAKNSQGRMIAENDAKNYDAAKTLAIETKNAAEQAVRDASVAKESAKAESARSLDEAKKALAEAVSALTAAKTVKGLQLDMDALKKALDDASANVKAIESSIASSRYNEATASAKSVFNKANDITRQISEAAQEKSKKK